MFTYLLACLMTATDPLLMSIMVGVSQLVALQTEGGSECKHALDSVCVVSLVDVAL